MHSLINTVCYKQLLILITNAHLDFTRCRPMFPWIRKMISESILETPTMYFLNLFCIILIYCSKKIYCFQFILLLEIFYLIQTESDKIGFYPLLLIYVSYEINMSYSTTKDRGPWYNLFDYWGLGFLVSFSSQP